MRKCRSSACRAEIPRKKDCSDPVKAGGFCGMDCLIAHTRAKADKAQQRKARREIIEAKERIKTNSDRLRELQTLVNRYVRLRDRGKPCISCDRPDDGRHQRHASHYRSVGACSSLRFNTFNIHASCAQCNSHMSGNIVEYRIRLARKVGQDRLEWLESMPKQARYSDDWIERAKRIFRKRCRLLERRIKL